MKVRDWECRCGHKYTAEVRLSEGTPNLSGEATAWCPKCYSKPLVGSPIREIEPPPVTTQTQIDRLAAELGTHGQDIRILTLCCLAHNRAVEGIVEYLQAHGDSGLADRIANAFVDAVGE